MRDKDAWDRYGVFYEQREKREPVYSLPAQDPRWRPRKAPVKRRGRALLGWTVAVALAVVFWAFFFWAGTRHWPH